MGTTADKLNYLNNTKGKLKTVINLMGTEIEDSDTFRSYSDKLQEQILKVIDGEVDLYDEYPKTTTTGTSALIQNTINHKMKIELDSVELTQDGTPTPTNPIAVNVIKDNNNIKIQNKNLLDKNNMNVFNGGIQQDTLVMQSAEKNRTLWIKCKSNTTYTVQKRNDGDTNRFAIASSTVSPSGGSVLTKASRSDGANNLTLTTGASDIYLIVQYYRTDESRITYQQVVDSIQIEENSEATEYVEHLEQNYSITLSSKNLLDFNNITVGKLGTYGTASVEGHNIIFTANNQTVYGVEIDLKDLNLKPNASYTISNLYENTGSFGGSNGWRYYDGTSYTVLAQEKTYFKFTTGDGTTNKLYFYLGSPTTYTGTLTLYNIQLLEGLVLQADIPDYQAYFTPIDYCKIGNYKDQIFKNTTDSPYYDNTLLENQWYLKKNIGKVVLDGSESWIYNSSVGSGENETFRYTTVINDVKQYADNTSTELSAMSNYFLGVSASDRNNTINQITVISQQRLFLCFVGGESNPTFIKNWLTNNNTTVYYLLNTSQYIHISQADYPTLKQELDNLYNNAKSYDEQTNITQTNDDLPFNLKIETLNDVEV